MKYNGIELTNMTPESWDGKTREMLVWNDYDPKPRLALVCGFSRKGHPIADIGNYKKELAHSNHVLFQWCSEIPTEEPNKEQNIDEMIKILNAYKEGKTIEHRFINRKIGESCAWMNMQKPVWNWDVFEYRIANEPRTKKLRRMTNKELFKWLAQGNGAMRWSSHELAQVTTQFEYYEYQENCTVASGIIIRGFHESEWHEPLIEE